MMNRLLTAVMLVITSFTLSAQDVHFTLYNHSPLNLNPGFTGAFYGTFRVGAVYRDQFFNVNGFNGSFTTPNIYIDAPIIKGFRDKDWVGVGANIMQDQAGSLDLTQGSFLGNVAYHIGLGESGNSTLAVGIQAGFVSRGFQDAQVTDFTDPAEMVQTDDINYFNMGAGVVLRTPLGANSLLEAGVSAWNLTTPDYAVRNNDRLPRRYTAHGRLKNYLTEKVTLTPSLLFMTMDGNSQFSVQALAGFMFDPVKEIEISGGFGYRFNELSSLELLAGLDWGNFRAAFGYDFGLSSTTFAGGQQPGGFEIAASYIARIFKKPDPKPTIFCPRF